jgi:NAD(P)-dependent dehydrogenase (short-subunit alcohol dehydrogenase family)
MSDTPGKTILITGASSGIGKHSAIALAGQGFHVYAGVRNSRSGEALVREAGPAASGRIEPVDLDVTSQAQIEAVAAELDARLGEQGLWGLFNNAGITVNGPLEFLPLDDLRYQLDVNLIGQLAVTQAMLPMLRRARGRILSTGSIAGFFTLPGLGPYSMSKHAMEAFSDALRRELRPWGIQVSLLEPGAIATDIWAKGRAAGEELLADADSDVSRLYGPLMRALYARAGEADSSASPPEVVTREVVHAFTAERARPRYRMGKGSAGRKWLSRLPASLADRLMAKALQWG